MGDNVSLSSGPRCRICLSNDPENPGDLITPCNCAGTIGLVHASCLEHWASVSCRMYCEICKCKYRGRRIPKYGLFASIVPFIAKNWNPTRVLIFFQASFLFLVVNMEIGNYGYTIDDPDFPKPSSLFLLWCLITFNFLVYFISFNVANALESWNTWRRNRKSSDCAMQREEGLTCRICLSSSNENQLIKPCKCNGTMQFVHATCLQCWISTSGRLKCEICSEMYCGRKDYKYGIFTSFFPYVRASWHRPKINFSLLIIFHLAERTLKEAKRYCSQSRNKYQKYKFDCQLLFSILQQWLDYLLYPQSIILLLLAFRDWSAWRQTQIVFLLER